MVEISIPGRNNFKIENLVLDFNGTLAVDGIPFPGIQDALSNLAQHLRIYILTSDTFGNVRTALADLPVEINILTSQDHTLEKAQFIQSLGNENSIAIGNGANDHLMLKDAAIGIAVIQAEGASTKTIMHADLVFTSIFDAFDCIHNPTRMIASLRE